MTELMEVLDEHQVAAIVVRLGIEDGTAVVSHGDAKCGPIGVPRVASVVVFLLAKLKNRNAPVCCSELCLKPESVK